MIVYFICKLFATEAQKHRKEHKFSFPPFLFCPLSLFFRFHKPHQILPRPVLYLSLEETVPAQ
jgi:hypothetical protein